MKRKEPKHPRLFIKAIYSKERASQFELFFKSNFFNSDGSRSVEKISIDNINSDLVPRDYLVDINRKEYMKLKKYIKIQKIVLEKREKTRNYDAAKIINNSIIEMKNFKNDFEKWFNSMEVEI